MITLAAYYYPGWHKKGKLSEWNIIKTAKPYFEGHHQPKKPLLGYLDDSLASTLKTQTTLAQSYGIDSFIFDWYWKNSEIQLEKSVKTFTKISTTMKFALMWTWKIPRKKLPLEEKDILNDHYRWINTSKDDFLNLLTYCNEHYFNKKNYWQIDGKPYFVMYCAEGFLHKLGAEKLSEMLTAGRKFLVKKGFGGLHVVGAIAHLSNKNPEDLPSYKALGFDALTGYNFLPDFHSKKILQDYAELSDIAKLNWDKIMNESKLPYTPSISLGWDATPKGIRLTDLSKATSFPWMPIVINSSPDNFGKNLENGFEFIKKENHKIIHLCAWNEWSEGAHLEPENKYGLKFLEKVMEIKNKYTSF